MAITTTPLGFQKPDGNERVKQGDNVISDNAQKSQDLIAAAFSRLGQAEANISAGNGTGPGLSEDPLNPGTYFMANASPITPDPVTPGLYTF